MKKDYIKKILIYIFICFAISYLLEFLFILPYARSTEMADALQATSLSALAMMIPALSVLLTRLFTKEGFIDHKIKFNIKEGRIKYYILAWFLPLVLVLLGAVIYFAVFSEEFDWNMAYYLGNVTKSGTIVTAEALRATMISQLITGVILGPVLNCITCFGEEWGWRGYLLPKLMKIMPMYTAIIVDGVIWGLWHLPLIIGGKNYGFDYDGYPYAGILMMVLFCVVYGIVLSYFTVKTDSCIPAVIGHGALNSIASIGIVFSSNGGRMLLGPSITGVLSMIPTMITAVILLVALRHDNACIKVSSCDTISKVESSGESYIGQDKES